MKHGTKFLALFIMLGVAGRIECNQSIDLIHYVAIALAIVLLSYKFFELNA